VSPRVKVTPNPGVTLFAFVLLAINLRAGLAGVGPVVGDIRAGTGLANVAIGLLTTLPLLVFGLLSAFTPRVTRRLGVEGGVVLALVLIAVGILARSVPAVTLLFVGTIVLGVGIALGNVLLPALAKLHFPDRVGPVTSLYSSMMGLGATLAAGVTAPLAILLGWRMALGLWVVPVLVALVIWMPIGRRGHPAPGVVRVGSGARSLGRSRLAWQIALFMGLQSLTFYVILAWLPDLLQDRGIGVTRAGGLLALSQATGVLGTLIVPTWAGRLTDQRGIVWLLGALELVALGGLLLPSGGLVALWVGLIGFVLGGTFGLALFLLAVRAPDAETAAALSGMAQSVGYGLAALGPAAFGLLHDITMGWRVPILSLVLVLAAKVLVSSSAARPGMVHLAGPGTHAPR